MTTTERNDLLQRVFSQLEHCLHYECSAIYPSPEHNQIHLHLTRPPKRSGWDFDSATVVVTFDELCSEDLTIDSTLIEARFDEDARRQETESQRQSREREARLARDLEIKKAEWQAGQPARDRAELARLKALYET